ncbi:hypothetical protein LMH87_009554 [Akanthomyces muscarius]|uniref:Uncharacterized protein n=1 Tax=Akanthomyces muscarius TaxID=2231603 RepID=A0A9W8QC39_AKAMU|nr:hypothetical protein LMH87_009554 [Akanthomyces muscarius]KAJ4153046.1 hypothetical protein LMH87_009554 [Akanthomyces muscarius]
MAMVTEIFDALPESEHTVKVHRNEELLLTYPKPDKMRMWREPEMLQVATVAHRWYPAGFAPPRDIFKSGALRLEWQQMDFRQPFYHRNMDVEEISLQVDGERTLMTELGSVELRTGDWSRIPVGIAHDNYGRKEIHLLFYVIAPAAEAGQTTAAARRKAIPFEGWTPSTRAIEMVTECLGARGCDLAVSLLDEAHLLTVGAESSDHLVVQRASAEAGDDQAEIEWLYKSARVWLGNHHLRHARGEVYRSHRRAVSIHYQVSGVRTLVSQLGTVELHPGDFVSIPRGVAHTSIVADESTHTVVLAVDDIEMQMTPSKTAEPSSLLRTQAARALVHEMD